MTKRDKVAFALFAAIYGDVSDDPTFPQRNWDCMTPKMRANWYRQADIAIAAGA